LLRARGAAIEYEGAETLIVTGLDVTAIGDLAAAAGIPVHELSLKQASLEDVFMNLTRDAVDYQGAGNE
jgi:ABC-2 type transport system ATP-binding protein